MLKHDEIIFIPGSRVIFPQANYLAVLDHCKRKLSGNYLAEESRERKAFGLIGGYRSNSDLIAEKCFPLLKNARSSSPYDKHMDSMLAEHAVPSETPLSKRGWIAEPEEYLDRIKLLQQKGMILLGTYHMHRVAWPDDPLRDTPTKLDTVLAADSKMLMFIISMVNTEQPIMRAFYEGQSEKELEIKVV
jgi:hypothetical protein